MSRLVRRSHRGSALLLVSIGWACAPARQGPNPASEPVPPPQAAASVTQPRAFDATRLPAGDGFWCFSRARVQSKGTTAYAYERCLRTQEACVQGRAELVEKVRKDAFLGDESVREALIAATSACAQHPRGWCTTRGPEDVTKLACTGSGDCGKTSPLWFCTVTKEACAAVVDHSKSLFLFSVCEERS